MTRTDCREMYLDWVNNFLTLECFAETNRMKICDQCHGNGYISVDVKVYEDCPKCHCEGELEDVLMEEQGE